MMAHVENGRLVTDEKVDLPEGAEGEIIMFGKPLAEMSPEERAECQTVIAERAAKLHAEGKFLYYGYPVRG